MLGVHQTIFVNESGELRTEMEKEFDFMKGYCKDFAFALDEEFHKHGHYGRIMCAMMAYHPPTALHCAYVPFEKSRREVFIDFSGIYEGEEAFLDHSYALQIEVAEEFGQTSFSRNDMWVEEYGKHDFEDYEAMFSPSLKGSIKAAKIAAKIAYEKHKELFDVPLNEVWKRFLK